MKRSARIKRIPAELVCEDAAAGPAQRDTAALRTVRDCVHRKVTASLLPPDSRTNPPFIRSSPKGNRPSQNDLAANDYIVV
jgi:hypothetical protein